MLSWAYAFVCLWYYGGVCFTEVCDRYFQSQREKGASSEKISHLISQRQGEIHELVNIWLIDLKAQFNSSSFLVVGNLKVRACE